MIQYSERNIMEKMIALIGLTSGEQIVGKIPESYDFTTSEVLVKNPAILVPQEKGLGMAPWLMYTTAEKDNVQINSANVVFIAKPRSEINEQYEATFGSGLVVPPTKSIETPQLKITD